MKLSQTQLKFKFYSATVKPRPSADYIDMKISILPPTQLEFTVIEPTVLQRILQYQQSFERAITAILYFILTIISCFPFV